MSKLYIVGTPIGNMEDITLRAIRILGEADIVLCEDTRVTLNLLKHHGINKPILLSYHSQSKLSKTDQILDLLKAGKNMALVSDAGTPTISDPGSMLVATVKKEVPEVEIFVVPGPSAVVSALSISGLHTAEFTFLGFLPHKKGRQTLFGEIAGSERTMIFYESPHRIIKCLTSLKEVLSPERKVVIARELTKIYEQIVSGTAEEVLKYFETNTDKVRGEFVVLVSGK
jgi:16S rRNA (cytidine1402-2'-O)-methyltransferase